MATMHNRCSLRLGQRCAVIVALVLFASFDAGRAFSGPGRRRLGSIPTSNVRVPQYVNHHHRFGTTQLHALQLQPDESSLLAWVAVFSSLHIGMSAVRQTLITNVFGRFSEEVLGIVGRDWKIPDVWPGDSSGQELFPDAETTGRQIYRLVYTLVSFGTLGTAFNIYLGLESDRSVSETVHALSSTGALAVVATLAGAFSLASLVNASPLGLMPSFRGQSSSDASSAGDTLLGITRDDTLKLCPQGLTRITRHPLILPVVPWGISTSLLAGGSTADTILFGGLALYAIAGCYCQDLRVSRQEGSVGTTFAGIGTKLQDFYRQTSFVPLGAVWDGRQKWTRVLQEFPALAFLLAIPASFEIEMKFLSFLDVDYNFVL